MATALSLAHLQQSTAEELGAAAGLDRAAAAAVEQPQPQQLGVHLPSELENENDADVAE